MRVAIIGARWPDVETEREVLGVGEADVVRDTGESRDGLLAAASGADVILAGPRPRFDAAVIEQLTCRGIVRYGVGYDNVDVAAAAQNGIAVAFVPDYGTEAVALHAVALALAAMRRIPQLDIAVKDGSWGFQSIRPLHLPEAMTAGVVGFGRIGRAVACHLRDLGFERTLAHDEFVTIDEPGITAASQAAVLAADVISLHAPANADGTPLLGAAEIAVLQPGSILVNTSRGSLIDTAALVEGLAAGRPAIAALDVFNPEPPDVAVFEPVRDRVILTPHVAWYTEESERSLRVKTAEEAKRIVAGEEPRNPVPLPEEAQ